MPFQITCAACGTTFVRAHGGQRFCSQRCAGVALRTGPPRPRAVPPPTRLPPHTPGVPTPPLEPRPCAYCGTFFSPVNREKPGCYCSVTCRVAAEHEVLTRQG